MTISPNSLNLFSLKQPSCFAKLKPKPLVNLTKNFNSDAVGMCCLRIREALNPAIVENVEYPDHLRVRILSESLPCIQNWSGKIVVVKYGGAAMKSAELKASVVRDLVLLSCFGLRPIVVHGGGPEINALLDRLNIPVHLHDGLRVTDAKTMEVVSMVLVGKVNKDIVSRINCAYPGGSAVGLSGIDSRLLTARPSPNAAQLGFVGEVARVNPAILITLLNRGHIPVIASVAADESGQAYNINADTVAGEVAVALGAERLILMTDVAGILEDKEEAGSLVKKMDVKGVKKMMEEGKVGGGMIPKVECCVRAVCEGVKTASIIDGRLQHSLLHEIISFHGVGSGTTITC
ncbi:hypothetical protein V6N13_110157 [Hibiscus sabdariffa]